VLTRIHLVVPHLYALLQLHGREGSGNIPPIPDQCQCRRVAVAATVEIICAEAMAAVAAQQRKLPESPRRSGRGPGGQMERPMIREAQSHSQQSRDPRPRSLIWRNHIGRGRLPVNPIGRGGATE
jgi:hypothetical protein